jgi:hypothetical protein
MPTTKITNNSLADNAALNNLNAGASIAFTKAVSLSGNLTVNTNTLFVDSVNNRVGVGTLTPYSTLGIAGNLATMGTDRGLLFYNFVGTGEYTGNFEMLRFMPVSNTYWIQSLAGGTGQHRNLQFSIGNATMLLNAGNGNVGIGTTTPSERLTVSGNISATGTVIASNYNPAANVATFLASPTSANLAAAVSDETGTGALVFANTPTLVTPNIGAATGTSLEVTGNIVASGTANRLPHQTLSSVENDRILTQKTSARDDMWSAWQKRWIQGAGAGTSTGGTGFTANSGAMFWQAICGTAAIGRAGAFSETGLTVNPGQGAAWWIPSSFAVAFAFNSLNTNNVVTSNNITSGSNTFTISAAQQISLGHRIYSSAFPEETYVSARNGLTITASKNATSTPTTPHTVVFSPDQISRVVLGTTSAITRYELDCPNAQEVFLTQVAKNIGDTSLRVFSNIGSNGVAVMWAGQPYFILTTANAGIAANNASFFAACGGFPSGVTMSVVRCDDVVGTPVTTTGTWNGTVTQTNQITVASATNIVANQTVSGLDIPQNTTVASVAGTTVTLNQNITTSGSGVTLYFGYQRIFVDQNAVATATGQNCGFIARNILNQYIYGRGVVSGTTITNITSVNINVFDLTISNALTKAYANGVWLSVNSTASNTANNCIFMDFGSDPTDGYLKVRLGYMLNGLITYSSWTSFPKGNVPAASFNYSYQAVIDYNAATDILRLFADRNGDIVTGFFPKDVPKPPSTPTITLTGVSALNDKITNNQFGLHIYGNNVNTIASANVATINLRQMVYYPYQTFID